MSHWCGQSLAQAEDFHLDLSIFGYRDLEVLDPVLLRKESVWQGRRVDHGGQGGSQRHPADLPE